MLHVSIEKEHRLIYLWDVTIGVLQQARVDYELEFSSLWFASICC